MSVENLERWYEVIVQRQNGVENTWYTKQVSRAAAWAAVVESLETEGTVGEVISVWERNK